MQVLRQRSRVGGKQLNLLNPEPRDVLDAVVIGKGLEYSDGGVEARGVLNTGGVIATDEDGALVFLLLPDIWLVTVVV